VESGWQPGVGHRGGDLVHLADPAPALERGRLGGLLGLLGQPGLGQRPFREQGPLDALGPR
jgi:hypothetical protein